ncbi:MAG: DUF6067 family protein [Planctomycetota bacterium]|nr:DUF6067 family protein [Planctomycetota bacterium]
MKTAWMAMVVVALCRWAIGGTNLVPNGGFEESRTNAFLSAMDAKTREFYAGTADSPFASWAFGGRWEEGEYRVMASDEAHSGKRSCQIQCTRRGRGGVAAAPFVVPCATILKVSFWIKAKDANGGRLSLNFEGSPGDGWASVDLRPGTYDWMPVTKRVIVPGGKHGGDQTVVLFFYSRAEGSMWIDDVSVQTVDANAMAEAPDEPAAAPKAPRAIPEPGDSLGYRVAMAPALTKVFRDDDFAASLRPAAIEMAAARNEYESAQLVIEAPWRDVKISQIEISELAGPAGAKIPASTMKWNRVDYVQVTTVPPYFVERGVGWYPDPLMPAGPFTVEKLSRTPVWITIKTPRDCPAGVYRGSVRVISEQLKPITVPMSVTVWDFALADQTHLKTLTWLGNGVIRAFYGNDWSPQGEQRHGQVIENYQRILLEHRLGPGGDVAAHVPKRSDGTYDFSGVDRALERLIGQGMNAFIMGSAPNLKRMGQKEYSPQFISDFTAMIHAYHEHLRQKGWERLAYVYTYDEAPRAAWPEVKKIASAVKQAAPEVRILQCLNEPEGVKALTGWVDVFDVYVAQYHKAGVAESQKKGAEVWLAVCCYPMDHPNFFLEYPLLDMRVTPWICWKYGAAGFEYWSTTSWGRNWQKEKAEKWPSAPWDPNTFGRYNGDGQLLYPGENGQPYSSLRLEALRDGLEDYEYLWTLREQVKQADANGKTAEPAVVHAKSLLSLDGIITGNGSYAPDVEKYAQFREKVAAAIVGLERLNRGK